MINKRITIRKLQAAVKDANTRDEIFKPPKSKSQQPRGSLAVATKREKKENNDQHEDRN
jgi:hypothetical protein